MISKSPIRVSVVTWSRWRSLFCWQLAGDGLADGGRVPVGRERLLTPAFDCEQHPDPGLGEGDVRLPLKIGRIALGQRLDDGQAQAIMRQRLGTPADQSECIGDLVGAGREIPLQARVRGIGRRELADQRECRLERLQRLAGFAKRYPRIADLVQRDRQLALQQLMAGIGIDHGLQDGAGALGGRQRCLHVALIEIKRGELVERRGFEPQQIGGALARFRELALQPLHPFENEPDQIDRHAGTAAEFLRQIEDQRVGRARRGRQRRFGAGALAFGELALLGGDAPLPAGDTGEHQRHDQTRRGRGEDAPLPQTLGIAAARVGGKRLHDEAAHGRRQLGAEPLRKLRGAGDQRRRASQGNPPSARQPPATIPPPSARACCARGSARRSP